MPLRKGVWADFELIDCSASHGRFYGRRSTFNSKEEITVREGEGDSSCKAEGKGEGSFRGKIQEEDSGVLDLVGIQRKRYWRQPCRLQRE